MARNSLENEVSESMNFHPEKVINPKVALTTAHTHSILDFFMPVIQPY